MSLLPAVLVLGNAQVHVGISDSGDVASYVEAFID